MHQMKNQRDRPEVYTFHYYTTDRPKTTLSIKQHEGCPARQAKRGEPQECKAHPEHTLQP